MLDLNGSPRLSFSFSYAKSTEHIGSANSRCLFDQSILGSYHSCLHDPPFAADLDEHFLLQEQHEANQ